MARSFPSAGVGRPLTLKSGRPVPATSNCPVHRTGAVADTKTAQAHLLGVTSRRRSAHEERLDRNLLERFPPDLNRFVAKGIP